MTAFKRLPEGAADIEELRSARRRRLIGSSTGRRGDDHRAVDRCDRRRTPTGSRATVERARQRRLPTRSMARLFHDRRGWGGGSHWIGVRGNVPQPRGHHTGRHASIPCDRNTRRFRSCVRDLRARHDGRPRSCRGWDRVGGRGGIRGGFLRRWVRESRTNGRQCTLAAAVPARRRHGALPHRGLGSCRPHGGTRGGSLRRSGCHGGFGGLPHLRSVVADRWSVRPSCGRRRGTWFRPST